MIRLTAINSSPVKKGNTDYLTRTMIETAVDMGCETQVFNLAQLEVKPCVHCNFCVAKQIPERYCALKDDAQTIFESLKGTDILLLSSPVYHMRTNAQMAALADRLRVFIFGNVTREMMKDKIGISAAVAWHRQGGLETTHLSHFYLFYNLDMLALGCHQSVSPLGASALSSRHGNGIFEKDLRLGVAEDEPGLESGRKLVKRAVNLAKRLAKD